MVLEECPGVYGEPGSCDEAGKPGKKVCPVRLVSKDGSSFEPPHHHVVEDSRGIQARLAGHSGADYLQNC